MAKYNADAENKAMVKAVQSKDIDAINRDVAQAIQDSYPNYSPSQANHAYKGTMLWIKHEGRDDAGARVTVDTKIALNGQSTVNTKVKVNGTMMKGEGSGNITAVPLATIIDSAFSSLTESKHKKGKRRRR